MDTQTIVIESDVVESIFRPISMFLGDIDKGSKLSFISAESSERPNRDDLLWRYKFLNVTTGVMLSFTQFDLSNFNCKGKELNEVFQVKKDSDAHLCSEFTVLGTAPRLNKENDKMYPPFMFEGYDAFLVASKVDGANIRELKNVLFASKVKADFKDRYYRVLDIDKPILFYPTID